MPVHVSSTCAHRQEGKMVLRTTYTASGIITPIGGSPVHRLSTLSTSAPDGHL